MKLDVIGFGSLNLDEIWEVPREFLRVHDLPLGEEYVRDVNWFARFYPELRKHGIMMDTTPGGSAANTIAALRKLGFSTGFYGCAGESDLTALKLEDLGRPKDLRIHTVPVAAGRCLALIDAEDSLKDRVLLILPNANDMAGSEDLDTAYFLNASWLHLTSFVARDPLDAQMNLAASVHGNTQISFDPGAIYSCLGMSTLEPLLRRTDVLFSSVEELEQLTSVNGVENAVDTLMKLGIEIIVVKMGEKGLKAFSRDRAVSQPPIPARTIKDRTGAGDVAAAGFLAGMLLSLNIEECAELAAITASRSIEGFGRNAYPDRSVLETMLSRGQAAGSKHVQQDA
ncbi:carbohydrate kinase family protein [Desulfomonile tiedjei]|uniref:Sugar kinase, ribokinase n=1 Tax=Desulfomonile tiedjei (strain ATCC 49306 / DSM 6799 / DCB-1) TaxID=706587 RepID=I4CAG0_DESTA|nr:carbohydrate kinase family protein [Desulfomonile tiedjei]AFM26551.1 sugar kinase, ribokinase [Desulfomonile tiedjei DSM 6799]